MSKFYMVKRIFIFLVLASAFFAIFHNNSYKSIAYASTFSGKGTQNSPFLIDNFSDFNGFVEYCNNSATSSLKTYFKLTSDIVLNEGAFNEDGKYIARSAEKAYKHTPIKKFNGVLDGDGFAIKGLYIDTPQVGNVGLVARNYGVIKNLCLSNGYVCGYYNVGSIVGNNTGNVYDRDTNGIGIGAIVNCISDVFVKVSNRTLGGICGYNNPDCEITNCVYLGNKTPTYCPFSGTIVGDCAEVFANVNNCFYLSQGTLKSIGTEDTLGTQGVECDNIDNIDANIAVNKLNSKIVDGLKNWEVCNSQIQFLNENKQPITPETKVNVNFDYTTNLGQSTTAVNMACVSGDNIPLNASASRDNYEFIGWNTDPNAKIGLTSMLCESTDMTFYAIFKKDITLTLIGGEKVNTFTIYNKESYPTYTFTKATDKTDCHFIGWGLTNGVKSKNVGESIVLDKDMTYYAIYENLYNVNFDYTTNLGQSTTAVNMACVLGDKIPLNASASRDNYEFIGWNTDPNAKIGLTSMLCGSTDMTLYAIFKRDIKVTFFQYENIIATYELYNAEICINVPIPTAEIRTGRTFLGWGENINGEGSVYTVGQSINIQADTSLYSLYVKQISVSYDTKGGVFENVVQHCNLIEDCTGKIYDGNFVVFDKIPTLLGYDFVNWTSNGAIFMPKDKITTSKDIKLTANYNLQDIVLTKYLQDTKCVWNEKGYKLEICASHYFPLEYQWYKSGEVIPNANTNYIKIGKETFDKTEFKCVITATDNSGNTVKTESSAYIILAKNIYELNYIKFNDNTFEYDGETKSIFIEGDLPAGVTVSYINNDKIEVGEYTVEAQFSGSNFYEPIKPMVAKLVISEKSAQNPIEVNDEDDLTTKKIEKTLGANEMIISLEQNTVTLNAQDMNLNFDESAIKNFKNMSEDQEMILGISKADPTKFRQSIGEDIANINLIKLNITINNQNITDLGGKAQITLPYALENLKFADQIQVWRIENNQLIAVANATYKDGFVTFETDHFATFVIGVDMTNENTARSLTITIAIIILAGFALLTLIILIKKIKQRIKG